MILTLISLIIGFFLHEIGFLISKARIKIGPSLKYSLILTFLSIISITYPYEFNLNLALNLSLLHLFILISVVDIYSQTINDYLIVIPSLIYIVIFFIIRDNLIFNIINGLFSFLLLYIIFLLSKKSIGGGDVKLFFLLGLNLGFISSLNILFLASLVALIYYLYLYVRFDIRNMKIPFVPFITIGIFLNQYLSLIKY